MNSQLDVRRTLVTVSMVLILFALALVIWRLMSLEINQRQDRENIGELIEHEHAEIEMISQMHRMLTDNSKTQAENHDLLMRNNALLTRNNALLEHKEE